MEVYCHSNLPARRLSFMNGVFFFPTCFAFLLLLVNDVFYTERAGAGGTKGLLIARLPDVALLWRLSVVWASSEFFFLSVFFSY
jgi:hypothetical protein